MSSIKWLFAAAAFVGVLLIGGLVALYVANESLNDLPKIGRVSQVHLTGSDGSSLTEEDFKNKISIVNFFFTSCTGPCPRMNARVAKLYRQFQGTDRVQFVSVTVDPERDSLNVLKEYAAKMGVTDNRWRFATGSTDDIHRLAERVFLLPGEMPAMHSTKLVLVDADGWIRGYYSSEDDASIQTLVTGAKSLYVAEEGR